MMLKLNSALSDNSLIDSYESAPLAALIFG
jgi:hypothetical protein